MNKNNSVKDLEQAIINRNSLIADIGDDIKVLLTWDNEISNYRGYVEDMNMKLGIWTIESLVKDITEDTGVKLSVA